MASSNTRLHSLVKIGNTYGKIIKKRTVTHEGKKHTQYLVITKRGARRWVFKSDMTLIWW